MKTVFLVQKQSDTVEGRGPMVIDKVFSSWNAAAEYIDDRPGVMGQKAKWSKEKYGDWTIKEMYVYDSFNAVEERAEKRANLIARLTPEELELLGVEK